MAINETELSKARGELEDALQRVVRLSREDDDGTMFIQDWVIAVSSESMAPGQENFSYTNFINRTGMANYQVIGLHQVGAHYYMNDGQRG